MFIDEKNVSVNVDNTEYLLVAFEKTVNNHPGLKRTVRDKNYQNCEFFQVSAR